MFAPSTSAEVAPAPAVTSNTSTDLDQVSVDTKEEAIADAPPSMTMEEFEKKHPTVLCTVSLNMGVTLTCHVVEGQAYISSSTKVSIPSLGSEHPKPIFLYSGGSWISDSGKDRGVVETIGAVLDNCFTNLPNHVQCTGKRLPPQGRQRQQGSGVQGELTERPCYSACIAFLFAYINALCRFCFIFFNCLRWCTRKPHRRDQ